MDDTSLGQDLLAFFKCLFRYAKYRASRAFSIFEQIKSWLAAKLYQQRGRWARPFIHMGMALLVVAGVTLGPVIIEENFSTPWEESKIPSSVMGSSVSGLAVAYQGMDTATLVSIKPRSEMIEYTVEQGDMVSIIAEKFGVSVDTIRWENNLESVKAIKPGQKLRILPATGVLHKVKYGDTIYTIAKKYQIDAQVIVDWPYNSFANDETFALAAGQTLMIPDGIKPKEIPVEPRRYFAKVPAAGTVAGTGRFAWPTSGNIPQNFTWYHKAIDIVNKDAPNVLASDTGQVIVVGWPTPWAYGNRVIIDHGNGMSSLYAHLQQIYVSAGQRIERGQAIGRMGSTGRSTGVHLHFEIRVNGVAQNPLGYLSK